MVVESAAPGYAGAAAGLQPGDILVRWRRPAGSPDHPPADWRPLATFFDWCRVENEELPRGDVLFEIRRGPETRTAILGLARHGLTVHPAMGAEDERAFLDALAQRRTGQAEAAIAGWTELAERFSSSGNAPRAAWLHYRIGLEEGQLGHDAASLVHLEAAGRIAPETTELVFRLLLLKDSAISFFFMNQVEQGIAVLDEALRISDGFAGFPVTRANLLRQKAFFLRRLNRLQEAEDHLRAAQAVIREAAPDSLMAGWIAFNLGGLLSERGFPAQAEEQFRQALAIRERLLPNQIEVPECLDSLGYVLRAQGRLEEAESFHRRAQAMWDTLKPESLQAANTLNNLGILVRERGRLEEAAGMHRRALDILAKAAPGSLTEADCRISLGLICLDRGQWEDAEGYFRQALAIQSREAPGSLPMSASLNNLGVVERERGNLDLAGEYFRQALAIREKLAPESVRLALSLHNLGYVDQLQGRPEAAGAHYRRALELWEKLSPESEDAAWTMVNLGFLRQKEGDPDAAAGLWRKALAIAQARAPQSLLAARVLQNLGGIAKDRRDPAQARLYFQQALEIVRGLAPGSVMEGELESDLGHLARGAGQGEAALEHFERAVAALDLQVERFGGTEADRLAFRSKNRSYNQDLVWQLLDLERPEAAFHALERYRARTFLQLLAERDLLAGDIPAELAEARQRLAREYDRLLREIDQLVPGRDPAVDREKHLALQNLQRQREEIVRQIVRSSPQLGELRYPEPLDYPQSAAALDPGTAVLAYLAGPARQTLFVFDRQRLRVFELPTGPMDLSQAVAEFRTAIVESWHRPGAAAKLRTQAAELYERLVRPAEPVIASAQRILILPDGPLHALPFGALWRRAGPGEYLVQWRPLHTAMSMTVYRQLQARRKRPGQPDKPTLIAACGDPAYPAEAAPSASGPIAPGGGADPGPLFAPLPSSRSEVTTLAAIFPGQTRVLLGREASEENARAVGTDARFIHFACHGVLDERYPLNSALVLSLPEHPDENRPNGLLQAWEIFERVRVDADLVTLSACQTGLGRESGGEGLVGLSRAFQYAGARSVLASLWNVADESTAELMKRFYTQLKADRSKDQALRLAQLNFIRRPIAVPDPRRPGHSRELDASHPFFWAGFELIGDWQ